MKSKNIKSEKENAKLFLKLFPFLADKYLNHCEKTYQIWDKKIIPMNHSTLNEFYCWIKNNYKIKIKNK